MAAEKVDLMVLLWAAWKVDLKAVSWADDWAGW